MISYLGRAGFFFRMQYFRETTFLLTQRRSCGPSTTRVDVDCGNQRVRTCLGCELSPPGHVIHQSPATSQRAPPDHHTRCHDDVITRM